MGTMISLVERHNSKDLWQWDKDRQIKIECESHEAIEEVHFSNVYTEKALIVKPYENESGELLADIPNILLTHAVTIEIYIAAGRCTKKKNTFEVNPRKKPFDYVYTKTEIKDYDTLEKRVKVLEEHKENGNNGIKDEIDPTVPEWAKHPTKPAYTPEEIGAASAECVIKILQDLNNKLSKTELQNAINTALKQAKESGEFNGKDGEKGDTPIKGTDYFTEADKTELVTELLNALPTWQGGAF